MIVKDDRLPHGLWKLGIVQEIMKGRDGQTRAAVVKIASCDQQHSILKRPIQLLYPLEIQCESTEKDLPPGTECSKSLPQPPDTTEHARPKRVATKKADEVRRGWIAELEKDD